ncbi:MAG: DUF364 domain-containing protein [Coriobacteriia bacterium]|nr:DUF364 domain-containing protein [Coriobacteriia bacterium]
MSLSGRLQEMIEYFAARFAIPRIAGVFLPSLHDDGQPGDEQFMALFLEGGATGISFVMIPPEAAGDYRALSSESLVGRAPQELARAFGGDDPIAQMLGMASINAICQHVMNETGYQPDVMTDSLGLLAMEKGDEVGMVGLFSGLVASIQETGAELVIIEMDERLIAENQALPITADTAQLGACNKVLVTGTTVLNNTLENVLAHCAPDALVSVVGPTVGYFPDPLFACGVDIVGGRVVTDSEAFLQRLTRRERLTGTTQRTCFQKATYQGFK